MDVIIDTSILRKHLSLRGAQVDLLIDYLSKTKSSAVITALVLEEAKGLYRRELEERISKLRDAQNSLRGIPTTIQAGDNPTVDFHSEVEYYVNHIHAQLHTAPEDVVPFRNDHLPELVARAIARKKPINSDGQQFRDALLWLTILDYAETTTDRRVAFVSANTREFAERESAMLLKELIKEASDRNVEVLYYSSLEDLIRTQASLVDFVTEEWVRKNFDLWEVERRLFPRIEQRAIDKLNDSIDLTRNEHRLGSFERTGSASSSVDEYYLYEKQDGSLVLHAEVVSTIEFVVDVERDSDSPSFEYVPVMGPDGDIDYDLSYADRHSQEKDVRLEYADVSTRTKVSADIVDKGLKAYTILDWDWD